MRAGSVPAHWAFARAASAAPGFRSEAKRLGQSKVQREMRWRGQVVHRDRRVRYARNTVRPCINLLTGTGRRSCERRTIIKERIIAQILANRDVIGGS